MTTPQRLLDPTAELIDELRAGQMVVLVDDEDRENEGDLVMAADAVTPEAINFMAKYGRGLICLTLRPDRCQQLRLPLMVDRNRSPHGTAFTVSIEAATGVSTGISAADRARTVQAAVAAHARPEDLVQPGHVFPLMAQPGGVLARAGHTEAGCDLAELAGRFPAAVICEILKDDGSMARLPDLLPFAREHGLKLGSIADLIQHRTTHESLIEWLSTQPLQHATGTWEARVYRDRVSGQPHLALVYGQPTADSEALVRVHEPITVFDLLGMGDGHHSWSLPAAMARIAAEGCGVMVLLNCASPADTLLRQIRGEPSASVLPPLTAAAPASSLALRTYGVGASILRDLGLRRMRLMAQPRKMPSMAGFGLEVCGYETPSAAQSADVF